MWAAKTGAGVVVVAQWHSGGMENKKSCPSGDIVVGASTAVALPCVVAYDLRVEPSWTTTSATATALY